MLKIKSDCRYFKDSKPCIYGKRYGITCESCRYYDKIKEKILIINLVGMGDVLRSTSLLRALKKIYPKAHITWLTAKESKEVLLYNPYIDRILVINLEAVLQLMIEKFDIVINLDKDHRAAAIATLVKANKKLGLGLGNNGYIMPFNEEARYFIDIGLSDKLKKASRKTQQEIIFDIAKLPYNKEKIVLNLPVEAIKYADSFFKKVGISNQLVVGFNTGCSNKLFTDRKWTINGFVRLAELLHKKLQAKILLFGGINEIERNREIISKAPYVINTGLNNFHRFAALIQKCDLIVTGDTLAVHVAAALDVPSITLFGCVSPYEIEIYGNGLKIVSNLDCVCCYKYKCEKQVTCMDLITAEEVFNAIIKLIKDKKIDKVKVDLDKLVIKDINPGGKICEH